ncbi:unnamed protein product, partial [Porites evermanni]
VLQLDISVATYTPLRGSSHVKLPKELHDKKAILNIRNDDQKCFPWSVLAALHPINHKDHAGHVRHYTRYEQELTVKGITFPMKLQDIPKTARALLPPWHTVRIALEKREFEEKRERHRQEHEKKFRYVMNELKYPPGLSIYPVGVQS